MVNNLIIYDYADYNLLPTKGYLSQDNPHLLAYQTCFSTLIRVYLIVKRRDQVDVLYKFYQILIF